MYQQPYRLLRTIALTAFATVLVASASAQQPVVPRYDIYAGYTDIDSPALGLNQQGFHTQVGMNVRSWTSTGFDYSIATGSEILTTSELPAAKQAQINGAIQLYQAAGLLPPGYQLAVKTDALTQTFAFGPQLVYRHYAKATFFLRPSLGALREHAVPHPSDPFATLVVGQLAPAGFKQDWTGFYGVGGGGEFAVTSHFGVRAQLDAVYNHPFNDILANARWTYRYSVGPTFHFGRNIAKPKQIRTP